MDDEKKENGSDDVTSVSAKQTLKDLINITQPGDADGDWKVLEGTTSTTDSQDGEDTLQKKTTKNPFLEAMASSVRGEFDSKVKPKVDEIVSILDTHVAPHLETAKQHSSRVLTEVQQRSSQVLSDVQLHSSRVLSDVQQHTQSAVTGVQQHSQRVLQTAQEKSMELHQVHVQPHWDKAQQATLAFHDQQIKPKVDVLVTESTRAWQTTGSCLGRSLEATKQFVVTHRPYYWNTAPDLFDDTVAPWYLVLEEGTCRAFGQVVFCNNPVSGILIWLAILLASPAAGLCSCICVVTVSKTKK